MSQDDRRPEVGGKFYVESDDEGEPDDELEIDEVMSGPNDGEFNVAANGDFYDIAWSEANQRWEEAR
jgi:hypothetical protein